MKKTQASGRNLEAAINNALEKLQLTRDQVEVTVLQEGGFLKQFKVKLPKSFRKLSPTKNNPFRQPKPELRKKFNRSKRRRNNRNLAKTLLP